MSRLIVHTGDGRGKTTAAFGVVLRAIGHGHSATVVQFLKDTKSGEHAPLQQLGVDVHICGGVSPSQQASPREIHQQHRHAAHDGLQRVAEIIHNGTNCIVLDEVCGAIAADLLDEDDVISVLDNLNDHQVAICTGRYASVRLREMADTVSDINNIKHAFDDGIPAQVGVEQ